jgi:trk system potassium uptake protein TrkA
MRALIDSEDDIDTHTIGNTSFIFKNKKPVSSYIGKKIEQIRIKDGMIFGVIRSGEFVFANKAGKLREDDRLVIADTARR